MTDPRLQQVAQAKAQSEANLNNAKAENLKADSEKKKAEVLKTEQESQGKKVENVERSKSFLDRIKSVMDMKNKGVPLPLAVGTEIGKSVGKPVGKVAVALQTPDKEKSRAALTEDPNKYPTPSKEQIAQSNIEPRQGKTQLASSQFDMGGDYSSPQGVEPPPQSSGGSNISQPEFQETPEPEGVEEAAEDFRGAVKKSEGFLQKAEMELKAMNDTAEKLRKGYQKEKEKARDRISDINVKLQELSKEPPQRSAANLSFVQKVLGVLVAGGRGFLGDKNPAQLIDDLIEQDFRNQKIAYESKQQGLAFEANQYSKIYEYVKEDEIALNAFTEMKYKTIMTSVAFKDKSLNLQKINVDMQAKVAKIQQDRSDKINAQAQQNFQNKIAKETLGIKREAAGLQRYEAQTKRMALNKSKEQKSFHGIPVLYKGAEKDIVKFRDETSAHIRASTNLSKIINGKGKWGAIYKEIKKKGRFGETALKLQMGAKGVFRMEDKYRQVLTLLTSELIKIASSGRIQYTGGGQLSEGEKRLLGEAIGLDLTQIKEGETLGSVMKGHMFSMIGSGVFEQAVKKLTKESKNNYMTKYTNFGGGTISREQAEASYNQFAKDLND